MKLKVILKDALHYAASDWYNVLLLGVVLFLIDHLVDLNSPLIGDSLDVVILIIVGFLSFMELGYGFRIVEETVKGSTKPPGFQHPLNLFVHGVKESVILLMYFIIPLILVVLGVAELASIVNLDFNPIVEIYPLIIAAVLFMLVSIIFQASVLNMAHHEGSLKVGFNILMVFRKVKQVGLKNMLLVSLITIIVIYIIRLTVFDALHQLPYLGSTVGDVIATVLVAPFLMLFTTRLLGLIDVSDENASDQQQ